MITFEEAKGLHDALSYDSTFSPRARLTAPIEMLAQRLDEAIALVGTVEIIVFPWQHAQPFKEQWENVPGIQSVRGARGEVTCEPWLWGHCSTYRGIDCFASCLVSMVVVSGVRDLRKAYAPEDRIVLIDVTPQRGV